MFRSACTQRAFSAKLFEEGVFASPICYPMVPRGTARVRVIVSANFSTVRIHAPRCLLVRTHVERKPCTTEIVYCDLLCVCCLERQEDCDAGLAAFAKVHADLK